MAESHLPLMWRTLAIFGIAVAASTLAACSSISLPNPFDRSAAVATPPPPDEPVKVDTGRVPGTSSIAVLVNDQPITRYDVTQRARLMAIAGGKGGEKAATDELIDETLEMYEAGKRGVRVPDSTVDGAYASIASNLKLTPSQLTQALAQQGVDSSTLKKRLRAQVTWQQLVRARAQATTQVNSTDVAEALLAKGDPEELKLKEYTLQQIIFVVPSGSSSGLYDQRRREAEAFRQRFKGCDQSLEQAKSLHSVVVKEPVRRDASQLTGPDGDMIKNTAAGKTARPAQTPQGIELIAVCSVREVQSSAGARNEVENQLFLKQAENLGADYLKELRDRAIIEHR